MWFSVGPDNSGWEEKHIKATIWLDVVLEVAGKMVSVGIIERKRGGCGEIISLKGTKLSDLWKGKLWWIISMRKWVGLIRKKLPSLWLRNPQALLVIVCYLLNFKTASEQIQAIQYQLQSEQRRKLKIRVVERTTSLTQKAWESRYPHVTSVYLSPHTKFSSRWIRRLNVRPERVTGQRKGSISRCARVFWMGLQSQEIRATTNDWGLMELSFNQVKKCATE